MKKLLAILLFTATSVFGQVTPTTVIQISGENWDGVTMSGHVGGPMTEIGNVYSGTNGIFNGKKYIGFLSPPDSLVFDNVINTDTSDYIVFSVHFQNLASGTGGSNILDFRNGSGYHLIIPAGVSGDIDAMGWHWGLTSNNSTTESILDSTSSAPAIRCWILREGAQRYYRWGGDPKIDTTGQWEAAPLIHRRRLGLTPAFATDVCVAHISVHKLVPGQTPDVNWINDFGDSLATFYDGAINDYTWIDILGGMSIDDPTTGTVWQAGDTVQVDYLNQTANDTTKIWLSRDNGTSFEYLGEGVADTLFSWIVTATEFTNEAIVSINDPDSSNVAASSIFSILPASQIDIIYPIEKTRTIVVGDTAQVKVSSIFCNHLYFTWSNDSTNWHAVTDVAVDTVNGQYIDTTDIVWTFGPTVIGPTIYLRVEQFADTTIYDIEQGYVDIGDRVPLGSFICQTYTGGNFIESRWIYDPSCGWANVTRRYYNVHINDDGLGYTRIYNACDWPWTDPSCVYPRLAPVYLTTAIDTTETALDLFYTSGSSVTYKNRLYFYYNQGIYMNDLINNVDTLLVADLSTYFSQTIPWGSTPWDSTDMVLQIYNVQYSKISGEYLPADTTFENLNDVEFEPKILVGTNSGMFETVAIVALDAPPIADPAVDTVTAYTSFINQRFYFRGIHPKIDKDR